MLAVVRNRSGAPARASTAARSPSASPPKVAHSAIGFRVGSHTFPFEQFDLRLNRPDKVLEALGSTDVQLIKSYRRLHEKRLEKMGFTEAKLGDDFQLPEIAIQDGDLPMLTTSKQVSFKILATDARNLLRPVAMPNSVLFSPLPIALR